MDTSVLEDIGLSPVEIKVFITMLELGECKAGEIIKKSKLQSSSMYNSLHHLIERGLVSYIKKGGIKLYKAANPESLLDYVSSKKEEYLKLLPSLKERQKKAPEESVEFFKSYKGIKTLYSELFKDAKKGEIFKTFSVEEPEQYKILSEKVFIMVKQIAKEKKIIQKGIFSEKTRKPKKKTSIINKRYLDIPFPPLTSIINNKVAIISLDKEPSGVLIHSRNIAEKYSVFFEHLWKLAKK